MTEGYSKDLCSQPKKAKFEEETICTNEGDIAVSSSIENKADRPTVSNLPQGVNNEDNRDETCLDPLGYTRDKDFTSEIFKVQIHNLPKFGFSDFKKRLKSHLGLKPNKIKSPGGHKVAYVCFRSKEERDAALEKINGHIWKGYKLEAKVAAPIADPYLQRRQQLKENTNGSGACDVHHHAVEISPEEAESKLRGNVCPLWDMEYLDQLQQKTDKIKTVLQKVTNDDFVRWMFRNTKHQFDGMPCELLPIVPSPEISQYRNKNEFTIGYGLDGKTVTVGFRYGLYKDGITAVGDCSNLGIAMPAALPVVKSFTEFVTKSKWKPFKQQTGTGHWQTLTVRTFTTGDIMVMVDFVPRDLEQHELEEARTSIKEYFTTGEGSEINIKSFYFRVMSGKGKTSSSDVHLIFGVQHVYEQLLNMKFRISPEAFFQVNTLATEKLYSLIRDWCDVNPSSTVLDVCCGTGTIGLALAKSVKEVIGIEMCVQAVDDAKANAEINGVTNATYYCSKVEDVINNIVSSVESSSRQSDESDVVAVVDPPRAGLHKDVIRSLRKCTSIKRLIFVSCNPECACINFIDLIRQETSRHKGSPFKLVKAIPVDLFPGTRHCELVLMFTRDQKLPDAKVEDHKDVTSSETKSDGTVVVSSSECEASVDQSKESCSADVNEVPDSSQDKNVVDA